MSDKDREYDRSYVGISVTREEGEKNNSCVVYGHGDNLDYQESDFLSGLFGMIEQDLLKHLNLDEPFVDMDVRIRETVRKYIEDGN
tara:strand:+ start:53 stop:310 length:258 start_codon:yes stop_codon:yes gene_type:complete